jgi:hypothetical protein
VRQTGYPNKLDIYIWLQPERVIVSYGDVAARIVPTLKMKLNASCIATDFVGLLEAEFSLVAKHSIKYCFECVGHSSIVAQTLGISQYSDYEAFFMECNPSTKGLDWLCGYFDEMVRGHYCVGVYEDGRLVSCTDAPSMPYMADKVQEIGINTVPEYRGKGCAAAACKACAKNIITSGKAPQWSTGIDNIASQKTAECVGFVKLADVLTVNME